MASKPWQGLFENNRRIRSKLPSANLQVTCAPASCSLAPQNPSQLHNNRSLINKHCWPLRFDMTANYQVKNATWIQYSSLATASAQQCNTCYRRDGTIASRSINRENNIEALAIFKKIQIALGSPNIYEFYGGAKKNELQWKKWTRTCATFPPLKVKTRKFSGRFTLQSCKSTARKCTRKCAEVWPIVVFHSSGQGHPMTVFCKISVRKSKFCLEFSFWLG